MASTRDYEHVTKTNDVLNVGTFAASYPYEFGTLHEQQIKPYAIIMQPNDYLTMSYDTQTSGPVYIVLWEYHGFMSEANRIIKYSNHGFLDFKNEQSSSIVVQGYLAAENTQNIVPTNTVLTHYDKPHWLFFGIGVVTVSLAIVVFYKSKR